MRKYDGKNKRNIGIIVGVSVIFIVIFSFFLIKEIKISKLKYELESSTVLFDIDKNSILLNNIGTIKKKWNSKYYLSYEDEQYNIGTHVIAFNNNKTSLSLYGEFYEVKSNSEVDITKEETILNNLSISRFYKIADRKYLIIDPNIRTEDESLKTINYLIVELDKQGNAILYNNNLNVKVFSASKILTTNYTFDIANELLIFENDTVDLKKILGTTNEYKEEEKVEKPGSGSNEGGTGEGTGNGAGGGAGNGTGTGGNNTGGTGTGGTTGGGNDIVTDEGGTDIGDNEIINQTAYTSIIRIVPSFTDVTIDYVIYDKFNEYLNTFVEIKSNDTYNVVHLSKSSTHITITDMKPGTDYQLIFKYKHLDNDLVKEETIDTHYVTTLLPTVTLTGTKVTGRAISYKISSSSYTVDSAKLRLYINGEKHSNEIDIDSSKLTGNFSISGISFPSNAVVELRLEEVSIAGANYNKLVSWSYRSATVVDPEPDNPDTPDVPDTPDNPVVPDNPEVPDNPVIPDTPVDPEDPVDPNEPDTPSEDEGEEGGE